MSSHQVVITGIGMVTPLGLDAKSTWHNIIAGQSGIELLKQERAGIDIPIVAGLIKNFTLTTFQTKHIKKMDWFIQYGLQAASEAIQEAGLLSSLIDPNQIGVSIGSGLGGLNTIETQYKKLVSSNEGHGISRFLPSPFFIPSMLSNMLAGLCAIEYNFQGPNFSVGSACATGAHNIAIAAQCIRRGDAKVMIAGGSEMGTTPLSIAGFSACRALSKQYQSPETASRPWDENRDGFVLADGATILVLEEYIHAKARCAPIYGELVGSAMSADAYDITAPEPSGKGVQQAIQKALKEANIEPEEVNYINAHATSTVKGDITEIKAIQSIWKDKTTQLKISATKSMTGHLLGAAGALEAAFCLLAIRDQIVPPTINLDNPALECRRLNLVAHYAQSGNVNIALSNSFGFGGTNNVLIFKRI